MCRRHHGNRLLGWLVQCRPRVSHIRVYVGEFGAEAAIDGGLIPRARLFPVLDWIDGSRLGIDDLTSTIVEEADHRHRRRQVGLGSQVLVYAAILVYAPVLVYPPAVVGRTS